MKIIALILSLLLLTSCSNPDTSGGVTLSRGGGDDANEFPNGSCEGQHENTPDLDTGCGWITGDEASYYIMPGADLSGVNLEDASLSYANLSRTDLRGADLNSVRANYRTICPNGKKWGTTGNNCGF